MLFKYSPFSNLCTKLKVETTGYIPASSRAIKHPKLVVGDMALKRSGHLATRWHEGHRGCFRGLNSLNSPRSFISCGKLW
jgi:hypothetical protein